MAPLQPWSRRHRHASSKYARRHQRRRRQRACAMQFTNGSIDARSKAEVVGVKNQGTTQVQHRVSVEELRVFYSLLLLPTPYSLFPIDAGSASGRCTSSAADTPEPPPRQHLRPKPVQAPPQIVPRSVSNPAARGSAPHVPPARRPARSPPGMEDLQRQDRQPSSSARRLGVSSAAGLGSFDPASASSSSPSHRSVRSFAAG